MIRDYKYLKLLLVLFSVLLCSAEVFAGKDYEWNGSVSSNWVTNGNWDANPGSQGPGAQTYEVFGPATYTNAPIISSTPGFDIDNIILSDGCVLTINSGTVDVDVDFLVRGGSSLIINGGTLNVAGDLGMYDDGSSITVNGGTLAIAGSIILGVEDATYPAGTSGSNDITINGGIVSCTNMDFDGSTGDATQLILTAGEIQVSNSIRRIGGAGVGDVDIDISGTGVVEVSGALNTRSTSSVVMTNGELRVGGNWVHRGSSTFTAGSVQFNGTADQQLTTAGAVLSFYNLVINNSAGNISLNNSYSVSNQLDLTDGLIIGNGNTVTIDDNATVLNASASSYIDGQINKIGDDAFTFPSGDGTFYNPISISAPSSNTDEFSAEYFRTDPGALFTYANRESSILKGSVLEYWQLDRQAGSSNVSVTLTWNVNSAVGDLATLKVIRWDTGDSEWKDEGNGGTTGNTTDGTISTSSPITTFSPFTFGTSSFANPLPVELLDFSVNAIGNQASVNWETASEINNNHFILQKTMDGENIVDIARIPSKAEGGNSTEKIKYAYSEVIDFNDVAYYRIIQVDHDGSRTEYPFEALRIKAKTQIQTSEVSVYPNPVEEDFVNVELQDVDNVDFTLISLDGKQHGVRAIKMSDRKYRIDFNSDLDRGVYLLNIFDHLSGELKSSQKIIVQ